MYFLQILLTGALISSIFNYKYSSISNWFNICLITFSSSFLIIGFVIFYMKLMDLDKFYAASKLQPSISLSRFSISSFYSKLPDSLQIFYFVYHSLATISMALVYFFCIYNINFKKKTIVLVSIFFHFLHLITVLQQHLQTSAMISTWIFE